MKICTSCNQEKEALYFYKNKRRKDGLSSRCKSCDDKSNKTTRLNDVEKARKYRRDWRAILIAKINDWKASKGCHCCSEREPCCLELHHLDPSIKEGQPTNLRTSFERFMKEAEKCIVVCSNCHKKIHAGMLSIKFIS